MSDEVALKVDHVYKKFRKGENHDSLRDLIPALAKSAFKRISGPDQLKQQEFWSLRDVSFQVKRGEAIGIIGHNGAGKSTMLKHLSGILQPTSGRIQVKGRLSALIEVGAGFHQDLTGRENIFLNGVLLGMSRAEVRSKFDEIVEFAGLQEFIDTPVKRYSSGMYARLGFSVAAHMEPDILIIDEVLSVGDFVFQAKGVSKMRSILNGGATVVFVSHNLRAVAELCPRSLLLRKGELVEDGSTSHVIHTYMEQIKANRSHDEGKEVVVESVSVCDANNKPRLDFRAGEKVWVTVTLRALKPVSKIACALCVLDDKYYEIFNTSTERLGETPATLAADEVRTYQFELTTHLANGSFYLSVILYRYDIGKTYDELQPAATLFIGSDVDVRGAVNLYPKVREIKVDVGMQASGILPIRR